MKKLITNYTFDASAKTVTFNDYTTINLNKILLITNVVDNLILYNFADATNQVTVSGNVLTLAYNTTSMSDTDDLQIFIDDGRAFSDLMENPFGTKHGQIVTSEKENFWNRLAREGRFASYGSNSDVIANTITICTAMGVLDKGVILYPKMISFGSTVNCYASVGITTGESLQPLMNPRFCVPANGHIAIPFDGEIYLKYGGTINIVVTAAGEGTVTYGGYAIEITEDD